MNNQTSPLAQERPRMESHADIGAALKALKDLQVYDYLRVSHNNDLIKFLGSDKRFLGSDIPESSQDTTEKLTFSDSVIKINKRGRSQARHIVVTNRALYNFQPKKYSKAKRRIALDRLASLILSKSSDEIVFQVAEEYDYRFVIQRRAELVEMVTKSYTQLTNKDLKIVFTEDQHLKDYVTTKEALEQMKSLSNSSNMIPRPSVSDENTVATPTKLGDKIQSLPSFNSILSEDYLNNQLKGFQKAGTIFEGWLTKQKGSRVGKWQRKFFILNHQYLRYYSPCIKGQINISKGCKVELLDPVMLGADGSKTPSKMRHNLETSRIVTNDNLNRIPITASRLNYAFKVTSEKRGKPLFVAAENKEDFERWKAAFENKVSPEEQEFVHLEGWLLKKVPSRRVWRRRYFVIVCDRCWYFEMAIKGAIDLSTGVSVHPVKKVQPTESSHTNFAGLTSKTRFAYRFRVSGNNRIYRLGADSQELLDRWLKEIEGIARQHSKGTTIASHQSEEMIVPDSIKDAMQEEAPTGIVTFVFTDVQSSTNLWESVPDAMDESLAMHDAILRQLLKKYKGYEVKTEGDAFMVTFFSFLDAILWCLDVQLCLLKNDWPSDMYTQPGGRIEKDPISGEIMFRGIRIRMGIHVGEPNCRKNPITHRMDYFGPVVNRSARVSDTAHGGQIVMTEEVNQCLEKLKAEGDPRTEQIPFSIRDLDKHWLKGIKEKVQIYEILPNQLAPRSTMFPPIRSLKRQPSIVAMKKMTVDEEKDISPPEERDIEDDLDDDLDDDMEEEYDEEDAVLAEKEDTLDLVAEV